MTDGREIISPGPQPPPWYKHLLPVVRFLAEERGHLPVARPEKLGFTFTGDGYECHVTRKITSEDWDAINSRFVIPANVQYVFELIRDHENNIDIVGYDEVADSDGVFPADVWVERQLAKGHDFGVKLS